MPCLLLIIRLVSIFWIFGKITSLQTRLQYICENVHIGSHSIFQCCIRYFVRTSYFIDPYLRSSLDYFICCNLRNCHGIWCCDSWWWLFEIIMLCGNNEYIIVCSISGCFSWRLDWIFIHCNHNHLISATPRCGIRFIAKVREALSICDTFAYPVWMCICFFSRMWDRLLACPIYKYIKPHLSTQFICI